MKRIWLSLFFMVVFIKFLVPNGAQAYATDVQAHQVAQSRWLEARVRSLTTRFMALPKQTLKTSWTSPPGGVMIFNLKTDQTTPGFDHEFIQSLMQGLRTRGISVVEPAILEQAIQVLNLTPMQIQDAIIQKQLALGAEAKILIILTNTKDKSALVKEIQSDAILWQQKELPLPNQEECIAKWVDQIANIYKKHYPLQGRILNSNTKEIIINLGDRHGVLEGMIFNVLSDGIPIDLADGVAEYQFEWLGRIRITRVAKNISFAKIESKVGSWHKSQKIIAD